MSTENKTQILQVIQSTPAAQIADLEPVRNRYIQNYNACHKEKVGDLMYHRNVVHFKQIIAGNDGLLKADPFSLYACFATAAAHGYSFDPSDNEVYLIARGGKAYLDRQAGAYVKRLMRTGQVAYFEQAKLVYEGDVFQVEDGRVIRHVENFSSDTIIAGYVRVVLDENGKSIHFIYRRSDWESWKKKSPTANGPLWSGNNGQPDPNFLRTKIVKHAAKEKCWASGTTSAAADVFENTEVDTEEEPLRPNTAPVAAALTATPAAMHEAPAANDHFAPAATPSKGITITDDDGAF